VFFACVLAVTLWLMKHDPKLLERRVNAGPGAEKEKSQQVIQAIASVAFVAIFVVSALDHRFRWSGPLPLAATLAGLALVAIGLYIVFLTFKENSFTSAIIEVGAEQKLVETGPYARVRHPMYLGAFIMLLGVPPALDSWWGELAVLPLILAIIVRLLEEERFLVKNLPGYVEYQKKVRWRLVPGVW